MAAPSGGSTNYDLPRGALSGLTSAGDIRGTAFVIRDSRIDYRRKPVHGHVPWPQRGAPTAVSLKPQDVCVLLKIVALGRVPWSYSQLAYELGMSASEVHAGVKRAMEASLMRLDGGWGFPEPSALGELLVHGVRYVFAPARGGLVQGMPTAHAAPPLNRFLILQSGEPPPVWPDSQGEVRGLEFAPLYKSVPQAARRDPRLYEMLALVDAIRGGDTQQRIVAVRELRQRLEASAQGGETRAEQREGRDNETSSGGARSAKGGRRAAGERGEDGKETRLYSRRH
jgi:hypothetical protein